MAKNKTELFFFTKSPFAKRETDRGPHFKFSDVSSGYSSGAEFLPVAEETMQTDDYELYDPRVHSIRGQVKGQGQGQPFPRPQRSPYAPSLSSPSAIEAQFPARLRTRTKKQPEVRC